MAKADNLQKRKWQIAFRRYVVEKSPSSAYAPYFGLDINGIRRWFELQFPKGIGWDDFGSKWQFSHIIPVAFFNFSREEDLRMCWNFTNLRVQVLNGTAEGSSFFHLQAARDYFRELYDVSGYQPCAHLLQKLFLLEQSAQQETTLLRVFIKENHQLLQAITGFTPYEMDLLNQQKSLEDIRAEQAFMKQLRH